MGVSFAGTAMCSTLTTPDSIEVNSGTTTISLIPSSEGEYIGCLLRVTDHAGNIGTHTLSNFIYQIGCGDGIINGDEQCDE